MVQAPRRRVAVVTDSTSDLPRALAHRYAITVVPQILILGDRSWHDGVDIEPTSFYALLKASKGFPSTSQASVTTFEEVFSSLAREADGIVAVVISGALSGTINSALAAAAALPHVPIEVVDSRSASMQLGLIALAAARAAAAGQDLPSVANVARTMIDRARVYFVVDTLEYLHRGGRIGGATRLLGTALKLKPVLEVRDGIVGPVAKIRTRHKALETLFEILTAQIAPGQRSHMAVLHVDAPADAALLAAQVKERFGPVELITSECGPVIGAHAGPGTVGVAYYVEPPEETDEN